MANFNHNEIPRDGLQPVTKSDETILETVDEIARQIGKDSDGNPIRALTQSMTDFLNGMENTVHMMILMLLFFMESIFSHSTLSRSRSGGSAWRGRAAAGFGDGKPITKRNHGLFSHISVPVFGL